MSGLREFHLGDILSISDGHLVSPNHMSGVYEILNYMTGDDLTTIALPRAADECRPYLLEQMPWLAEIDGSMINRDNWQEWLAEQVEKYGEFHPVRPIHFEDHETLDPVEELRRMGVDKNKIVIVEIDDPLSEIGDLPPKERRD